ncbi:SLAC1 anion channel family protein [Demequina mangrovi]|uniref:Tellurite resistance protein n=1 Tax=Demequina mangrovi TaxID=1043493 RepID=A0A1H6XVQ1_9MICO|nr:SLAC1 anion channel family protein [Demequina mangrovi]SEJ32266.1 tellurite resistance protein [Demequina mangrovi]
MTAGTPASSATTDADRSLAHLPVGVFAIAMGAGGTSAAWYRFEEAFGLSLPVNDILAGLGLVIVAAATIAYGLKAVRHPRATVAEWSHPVKAAFVATLPVALMVLSTAFLPISEGVSAVLWWPGAVIQFLVTVLIMRTWIADARIQPVHVHPAWFIPIVGNLVAPLAGVAHAPAEICWYFFGVGAVFWLGLLPVVLGRLFLEGIMPWRLAPTLAILAAPPAVASLSWVRLGGAWTDPIAMMLLGVVVFQLALLASQANFLLKVPFAVSAWAYTFPLAASASALLGAYEAGATAFAAWIGVATLAVVSAIAIGLGWRTVVAIARGELLTAEG